MRRTEAAQGDNVSRIAAALGDTAGRRWFRAPGRVNLMGDHTDYNEGFVLPIAIDLECVIAAEPRADETVAIRSLDEPEPEWRRYVDGVVGALAGRGRAAVGLDGVLASSVPAGSGLSSSAALEVACAIALCDVAELELEPKELALACQEAEHLATGVRSGVMDQLASIGGKEGSALLIDCRTLEIAYVPMPDRVGVVVVHSGVARTLVGSAYAERRAGCERIAARLGVPALRDARPEQVRDEPLGRHVVSENARVHEAADAFATGDVARLGEIFLASHASLRDDYAVSTAELDALVEAIVRAGAAGARLTGAGFGGAVVGVCERDRAESVAETAASDYARATGREPTTWIVRPAAGAGPLWP